MKNRLLIVQIAALGHDFLQRHIGSQWHGLQFHPADSVFPAVTCTVQGTMRTAAPPNEHGMMFNGVHLRDLRRPSFWEQSSGLVRGERIWRRFRERGGSVGMTFWQQSLGEEVDMLLSPWPVHKHGGKLVDTTYSVPDGLYDALRHQLGRPFRLRDYWGPLSQLRSSKWIAEAATAICRRDDAPDILFSYLPHLDYALQKYGPEHPRSVQSLHELLAVLTTLVDVARQQGREVVMYGDYAVGPAKQVLYPNRILREAGMMAVREAGGRTYPNTHESRAFAVVDHEVAHVFLRTPQDRDRVADVLRRKLDGDVSILTGADVAGENLANGRCGELVLAGAPGTWFAYPWWTVPGEAPDYAGHIDIHNKPGFDPCELFFGRTPFRVSTHSEDVRGTHGAAAAGREVAWASTLAPAKTPETLLELAAILRAWMSEAS